MLSVQIINFTVKYHKYIFVQAIFTLRATFPTRHVRSDSRIYMKVNTIIELYQNFQLALMPDNSTQLRSEVNDMATIHYSNSTLLHQNTIDDIYIYLTDTVKLRVFV